MLCTEKLVKAGSHYYVHTPSLTAQKLFLYPTIIGQFDYEGGYQIHRTQFDSFLIMAITEGQCHLTLNGRHYTAEKGDLVLVDCYREHAYGTASGFSCLWMHFDGVLARAYYEHITALFGPVVHIPQFDAVHYQIREIYRDFRRHIAIDESGESIRIMLAFSLLLTPQQPEKKQSYDGIRQALSYITNHFAEPIQLEQLAEIAALSPYYFSRLFAKETGLTPHQYIIQTRIASAKYHLTTSSLSVKEIAYETGFRDESSFCTAFKKYAGDTPSNYRLNSRKS